MVYRGGDVATAWIYTAVTATLGIGLAGVAMLSAAICAAWAVAGVFLGKNYDRTADNDDNEDHGAARER